VASRKVSSVFIRLTQAATCCVLRLALGVGRRAQPLVDGAVMSALADSGFGHA
jgi:hypothetical protein